jgi:predicted transcriptional regulator
MPVISITTTKEEQDKVLEAIKKIDNSKPVSIHSIALMAKMKESRVRYAVADLVDSNKIKRIPLVAFNKKYIRYTYKVVNDD